MVSLCITDVNSFRFICCILLQYVGAIPIPATLQLALFACQTKTASYSGCLCWWRTYSGHWRTSIQFSIHYVSGIWELCERPDESHSQSQRLKLWQSYASSCHLFPKWRPQEPTRVASDKDSGIQTGIHVVNTNNSVQWHVTLELLDTDLCAWFATNDLNQSVLWGSYPWAMVSAICSRIVTVCGSGAVSASSNCRRMRVYSPPFFASAWTDL